MSRNNQSEYRVVWEIDIPANSPLQAAKKALGIQRDPESQATVFKVYRISEPENVYMVDLLDALEITEETAL